MHLHFLLLYKNIPDTVAAVLRWWPILSQSQLSIMMSHSYFIALNDHLNLNEQKSEFRSMAHVPTANMECARLMSCTTAGHQGAIKMFGRHFWGADTSSVLFYKVIVREYEISDHRGIALWGIFIGVTNCGNLHISFIQYVNCKLQH